MATEQIILDIRAQIADAQKKLNQLKTGVGGVNKEVTRTETLFKKAAVAMGGLFAVSRVVQWGKAMMKVSMDFEKSMTNVITLLDEAQKKQLGTFLERGAARLMGEYGLAIQDVNKALFDTISAGVKASESVKFLNEAAKLAIGGVTSLSTAVDGMTSVLNAYGLAAKDAEKISSAFFTAQKYGKTTVDELANTIGTIAPIAKNAGVSFQELLSMMALLTKQGIRTEEASTALRATITALISPAAEAQKKFKELGIDTGTTAIREKGFATVLLQVAKAAQTDADVLSQLIPNVRALTGVAALGEEALAEYDEILKDVSTDYGENSSLARALSEQMETLEEKINQAGGAWENFILSVKEQSGGAGPEIINSWKMFFNWLAEKNRDVYERLGWTHEKFVEQEIETVTARADFFKKSIGEVALERAKLLKQYLSEEFDAYDELSKRDKKAADIRIGNYLAAFDAMQGLVNEEIAIKEKAEQEDTDAREKALKEEKERLEKEYKAVRDSAKEKAAFNNYFMDVENQKAEEMLDAELRRIEIEQEADEEFYAAVTKAAMDFYELQQEIARGEIDISKYTGDAKLSIVATTFGAIASLATENAELYKVMATAEALISTYLGAQQAFQGMIAAIPGPVGVALGTAAAIEAVIIGLANVAKIQGVSFAEGGYTGKSRIPLRDERGPIAGWVHEDEFVFDKKKTGELRPLFEDIHSGRIDSRALAALTKRGVIIPLVKSDFNSKILENEVAKIYHKMQEEKPFRYTEKYGNGQRRIVGNTTYLINQ